MKDSHLIIVVAGVAAVAYFLHKRSASNPNTAVIQSYPGSRNPNVGIGTGANNPNDFLSTVNQGIQAVNSGINAVKSLAGLGKGSTPGKTVGIATNSLPASGSGNESFDASAYIERISGSNMAEYESQYLTA